MPDNKRKDEQHDGRKDDAELAEQVEQQQHTGSHDKPGKERAGSDRYGGTRAGAENVEPKKR